MNAPSAQHPATLAIAKAMTEATLQEQVRKLASNLQLFHFHPYDSRRSQPGWPDSVIIGPRGILYRELKSQSGRPTSEQTEVGYRLKAAGADFAIWRPADLLDGTIARELAALM